MTKFWPMDEYEKENTRTAHVNRLRKQQNNAGLYDVITTKVGSVYIIRNGRN